MSRGQKILDLVLSTKENRESSSRNQDPTNYDEIINQPSTSSGVLCASMSVNSSPERSDSSPFPTNIKRRRYIIYSSDSSNEYPAQETRAIAEISSSKPAPQSSQSKARRNRLLGKPYMGYKKKDGKLEQTTPIAGRSVKSRCDHTSIKQKSKNSFMCKLVSEEERAALHFKFWNMKSWSAKKAFIQGLVSRRNLRRQRKRDNRLTSRKQTGFDIYVPKSDCQNSRVKVCRLFFLNTFDVGRDTFLRWVKETPAIVQDNESSSVTAARCHSANVSARNRGTVSEWLDLLPKVPSHYCRATSQRIYVESTFRSHLHMHAIYKAWCIEQNKKPVSRNTFLSVLSHNNISIHKPRKDQCDVCSSYQLKNVSQEDYDTHIKKKDEARHAKNTAIEI